MAPEHHETWDLKILRTLVPKVQSLDQQCQQPLDLLEKQNFRPCPRPLESESVREPVFCSEQALHRILMLLRSEKACIRDSGAVYKAAVGNPQRSPQS